MTTLQLAWPPLLRPRVRVPVAAAGRIAWTRRGERIAFGSRDALVVAGAVDGKVCGRFPSSQPYSAVACARNDAYLVCGDGGGGLDMFRLDVGRPGSPAAQHRARVNAVAFSGDDWRFYTASDDGTLGRFTAASWEARFFDMGAPALDVAARASGEVAVALGRNGVALVTAAGKREKTLQPPGRALAVAFSSDERWLFVGTREGRLHAYDAERMLVARASVDPGVGSITRMAALGELLVLEGTSGSLAFVDAGSGRELGRARLGAGAGTLGVHAGQRALAIGTGDGVTICDVDVEPPRRATDGELTLALYADGDALAARQILAALRSRGLAIVEALDVRTLASAAREATRALLLYGSSGEPLAWQLDVARHRGLTVVPVVLPGGAVPDEERAFDPLRYVCFGARLDDPDALLRVEQALRATTDA